MSRIVFRILISFLYVTCAVVRNTHRNTSVCIYTNIQKYSCGGPHKRKFAIFKDVIRICLLQPITAINALSVIMFVHGHLFSKSLPPSRAVALLGLVRRGRMHLCNTRKLQAQQATVKGPGPSKPYSLELKLCAKCLPKLVLYMERSTNKDTDAMEAGSLPEYIPLDHKQADAFLLLHCLMPCKPVLLNGSYHVCKL